MAANVSYDLITYNDSREQDFNNSYLFALSEDESDDMRWSDPEFILNGVMIPAMGMCGVVGNIMNLTILSWRCSKREIDVLERGALLGLIALAVSDLCFCLGILPMMSFYDDKTRFNSKNFHYYYQVYGIYFHDVFIKISTWLTVIIATARYVAICHPLRARIFAGLFATKVAIVSTYAFWFVLLSPILWSYEPQHIEYPDNNISFYVIDVGKFTTNQIMKTCFTYIWAFIGYFFPVTILAFCNIKLIQALRESAKWRECSARSAPSGRDANLRITSTLVALIVMFLILVSPSELLHFYKEVVQPDKYWAVIEMALTCTNLLQALNFAFHFVLYCAVNVTFRRTMVNVFYMLLGKVRRNSKPRGLNYRRSMSITRTFKSVETHV